MPFKFGDVIVYGFFVLLIVLFFRGRPRAKEVSRVSEIAKDDAVVASVVEVAPAPEPKVSPTASTVPDGKGEPTGRKVNVAGRGALFQCVEYRCDERYETRVHRIDERGKQISASCVYHEPFEKVMESFTTVAA
jgi:hypothetical protein